MSNTPHNIYIQKASLERINPKQVNILLKAAVTNKDNDCLPSLDLSLLVNWELSSTIATNPDWLVDITQTLNLPEWEVVNIQLQELTSNIKSKVRVLIDIEEDNNNWESSIITRSISKKITDNSQEEKKWEIENEEELRLKKEWITNKFNYYFKEINNLVWENKKSETEILALLNELEEFCSVYINSLNWNQQQFFEFEYPKLHDKIISQINDYISEISNNGLLLWEKKYWDHKNNREAVLLAIKNNWLSYQYIGDSLKTDKEIIECAIENNPSVINYFWKEILNNQDYMLMALKIDWTLFYNIWSILQNDINFIKKFLKIEWTNYQYLPNNNLRDNYELALFAVEQNGLAMKYLNREFVSNINILKAALKNNPNSIEYIYAINDINNYEIENIIDVASMNDSVVENIINKFFKEKINLKDYRSIYKIIANNSSVLHNISLIKILLWKFPTQLNTIIDWWDKNRVLYEWNILYWAVQNYNVTLVKYLIKIPSVSNSYNKLKIKLIFNAKRETRPILETASPEIKVILQNK